MCVCAYVFFEGSRSMRFPSTNHLLLASRPLRLRPLYLLLHLFESFLCSFFSLQTSYPLDVFGCQKMVVPVLSTI